MGSVPVPVNVFGTVVGDGTVNKQFPNAEVDAKDKSYFAFKLKEDVKNEKNAREHEQKLKNQYGQGGMAYTLCRIYNATGNTLTLLKPPFHYHGHVNGDTFPEKIENGQLAAVFHEGSSGAVIYSGKNHKGEKHAWLHAWKNEDGDKRCVFTKIINPDHYNDDDWMSIYSSITYENDYHKNENECYSRASISQDKDNAHIYIYDGIMTLKWCFPEST